MIEMLIGKIKRHLSSIFSPFRYCVSAVTREDKSGMLRIQMGSTLDKKTVAFAWGA
jgi:hypothetical protein